MRGTSRLEPGLTVDRKNRDHGTLHIRFGPHALSAPVVMKPRWGSTAGRPNSTLDSEDPSRPTDEFGKIAAVISIYLSLTIALAISMGWIFLDLWGGITMGVFLGIFAFVATWIVIGRRFAKRIQPVMMQAQRQAEAGNAVIALNTVQTLLPIAKWIPMLKGQLHAQMGVLSLGAGKETQAVEHLEKATHRSAEAKLCLAAFFYRKNKWNECSRVLETTRRYNKKHVLLHNVFAHLMHKQGDTDGAIAILNGLLEKVPENESTKGNVTRLKNGRKMSLKSFGMNWYSLGLERPPASMMQQSQDPRRGFRQKSKRK